MLDAHKSSRPWPHPQRGQQPVFEDVSYVTALSPSAGKPVIHPSFAFCCHLSLEHYLVLPVLCRETLGGLQGLTAWPKWTQHRWEEALPGPDPARRVFLQTTKADFPWAGSGQQLHPTNPASLCCSQCHQLLLLVILLSPTAKQTVAMQVAANYFLLISFLLWQCF